MTQNKQIAPPDLRSPGQLTRLFYTLMRSDRLRYRICAIRWKLLKKRLRFATDLGKDVGSQTISHNLHAFDYGAVFGMARRMSLLLFPIAALCKDNLSRTKVLIVGPRTEDDIFWAKSLKLYHTDGLDLFSYSPYIQVGDIHDSKIPSQSYDVILLGWMISYTSDPKRVVTECLRILKPGGYLGIGIESNALQKTTGIKPPRMNTLNSPSDLTALVGLPVAFSNDPHEDVTYDCGVVFKNTRLST